MTGGTRDVIISRESGLRTADGFVRDVERLNRRPTTNTNQKSQYWYRFCKTDETIEAATTLASLQRKLTPAKSKHSTVDDQVEVEIVASK